MRKVENNQVDSSNNGSCQSAATKDAYLQRQGSYHKQKEFALAFCKQLNENLKVRRPVQQIVNIHQKMPSVHLPPISTSLSERHKVTAPENSMRRHSLDRSVNQQSQRSVENVDKPIDQDHKSSSRSQGERVHHQATTPVGGRPLSLKRGRDSPAEIHEGGKKLCRDKGGLILSSKGSASNFSSPPKYVKRAFLKTFNDPVLTLKEKCSSTLSNNPGDRRKASDCVPKQLFREMGTGRHKLQSTIFHEAGHQKEKIKKSTENKCAIGNSATADPCPTSSNKFNQEHEESGSPSSSQTSPLPDLMDKFEISCSPQQKVTSPSSLDAMDPLNSRTVIKAKKDAGEKRDLVWKDPLIIELGEDVGSESCALSLSSSHSSVDDQLLSLKEIMERSTWVPVTPDKVTFSEPSTPGPKITAEDLASKATSYKNTLENMLKEKEQNQKSKEIEMQLLQNCKEDLLKLDEEDENTEERLSHEQKEFLQRFSVTSCAIRDIHPGEEVFTLTNAGRLFNHQSLDLRKIGVKANNREQQTLLRAHSEQLLLLLSAGMFSRAYSSSPCQPPVTRWLFQMMSVHPNTIVCAQVLQVMTTIALSAAQQIVVESNKKFEVWVPSIQDVALVFLNMGVSFVSLFPLADLQPPFTEGDLLESLEIHPEDTRSEGKGDKFPEHNFENIVKYLALCAALCPRVYSDEELLLMLTLVCRVSLETRLQLMPTGDLSCLLQHLLNNMRQWELQLPQVCQAISNLSEDHHNLRRLVQLLPHSSRGKQLRKHLSVSIISKLLNHRSTYTPSCTEFQLSDLRCYLPRMRPSLLLKGLIAAKTTELQETDDFATTPDQQAYYLCYSLLALTNEASNFEFLPSKQRNELLLLSAELEKHVKCDIRESEKMLYRSKVKDFVARIYTKWQVLLQRTRPQEGKLYDYWKPLPEDQISAKCESDVEVSEEEDTEESMGKDLDEEEPPENDETLEDAVEKVNEKIEKIQEVSVDIKEHQTVINLGDKDTKEMKDEMAIEEQLLGGSSEGSIESEDEEDPRKREELFNDEFPDRNEDLLLGENEELLENRW